MGNLKNAGERIARFLSVLAETTRTLSALLSILTILGFGGLVIGYLNKALPTIVISLVAIIVSALIAITLYSFIQKSVGKVEPQPSIGHTYPPPPRADVKLLLKEIIYEYFPDGRKMRQRKRFIVRALRDGVLSFPDRYRWTGSGTCIVRCITPGFTVTNERKVEFWDYFDVSFPNPIRAGEAVDFTVEWNLYDKEGTAVPFLSTMIDFETDSLVMRVKLPASLTPRRAIAYDFQNYIDTLPISTQDLEWNPATDSLKYEVRNPGINHKYMIRWFTNSENAADAVSEA